MFMRTALIRLAIGVPRAAEFVPKVFIDIGCRDRFDVGQELGRRASDEHRGVPAESPFNIVQKLLRLIPGVNAILPDLKDSDPRKAYQDTWYGTDISASLPKAMRSRTGPVTPSPPSDEDAEREREGAAGAGAKDAIAKESVEMVSNDEIS